MEEVGGKDFGVATHLTPHAEDGVIGAVELFLGVYGASLLLQYEYEEFMRFSFPLLIAIGVIGA